MWGLDNASSSWKLVKSSNRSGCILRNLALLSGPSTMALEGADMCICEPSEVHQCLCLVIRRSWTLRRSCVLRISIVIQSTQPHQGLSFQAHSYYCCYCAKSRCHPRDSSSPSPSPSPFASPLPLPVPFPLPHSFTHSLTLSLSVSLLSLSLSLSPTVSLSLTLCFFSPFLSPSLSRSFDLHTDVCMCECVGCCVYYTHIYI